MLLPTCDPRWLLIAFSLFTGFYTDLLWFRSVGYLVFSTRLGVKALLFVFGIAVRGGGGQLRRRLPVPPAYQALIPGQQELDRYRMALDRTSVSSCHLHRTA